MTVKNVVLPIALILCSTAATAADVMGFAVRDVAPMMKASAACDQLADHYQDERGLRDQLGIAWNNRDWTFSVDRFLRKGSKSHHDGCHAGFRAYDGTIGGAMTWQDHIDIKATNGLVYYVKNTQTLNVGNEISDCTDRRAKMVSGLIGKYGEPTSQREDTLRGKTFQHLIWDYSSSPSARVDDDDLEQFEAYIQCGMYESDTRFAEMKLQTSVHSGKAIQQARDTVKAEQTFEPTL